MLVSASPPPLPALTGLRDDKLTPLSSSPGLGGTPGETVRHCSAPEDPIFRFSSLHSYPFPGTIKSWDMSRKRHHLIPETFGVKRRRKRGPVESDPLRGEPGNHGNPGGGASLPVAESFVRTRPRPSSLSVSRFICPGSARAAVSELMQLFPRGLFEDALPPIVLRSQVYSLVPDRTVADRQLVRGVGATAGSPFPNSWNPLSLSYSASRSASIRPFRRGHCARHWGATETLLKGPQVVQGISNHGGRRTRLLGKPSHGAWFEHTALEVQSDVRS